MITTTFDTDAIMLRKFNHPEYGESRIIGDYDENPAVMKTLDPVKKVPHYKCQQTNPPKNYFMISKEEARTYFGITAE